MAPFCVILYFLSCPCHCCGIQVQSSHHPALCNYPLLTRNITMVVFHTTNTEIISQHNLHWTYKNVSVNSSSDQMDPTKLSCLQVTDRQLSNQYFNKKLDSMRWFSHQRRTGGRHPKHPLATTKWARPLLLHAVCIERVPFVRTRGVSDRQR